MNHMVIYHQDIYSTCMAKYGGQNSLPVGPQHPTKTASVIAISFLSAVSCHITYVCHQLSAISCYLLSKGGPGLQGPGSRVQDGDGVSGGEEERGNGYKRIREQRSRNVEERKGEEKLEYLIRSTASVRSPSKVTASGVRKPGPGRPVHVTCPI